MGQRKTSGRARPPLVSEYLAIRGFGLASLIGEVACVATALILVPALLAVRHKPVVDAQESVAA